MTPEHPSGSSPAGTCDCFTSTTEVPRGSVGGRHPSNAVWNATRLHRLVGILVAAGKWAWRGAARWRGAEIPRRLGAGCGALVDDAKAPAGDFNNVGSVV